MTPQEAAAPTTRASCAQCGRGFTRRHPSQRFCSPIRGRRVCKDAYHNDRREEAQTRDGVAVPWNYSGITDQEHDEIMSQDRDDF